MKKFAEHPFLFVACWELREMLGRSARDEQQLLEAIEEIPIDSISLLPLLQDMGMDARWEVISGTEEFFATTKSSHNALQGQEKQISQQLLQDYIEVNRENGRRLSFDADYIIIHDPQPAALIENRPHGGKWIWRCHIDISRPQIRHGRLWAEG
jgi:hypothetical protein